MQGYLEKGIRTPMAQGRSTKFISTSKWIRTSGLSIKNSLCLWSRTSGEKRGCSGASAGYCRACECARLSSHSWGSSTLNPSPHTLHPRPEALNPKP